MDFPQKISGILSKKVRIQPDMLSVGNWVFGSTFCQLLPMIQASHSDLRICWKYRTAGIIRLYFKFQSTWNSLGQVRQQ